MVRPTIPEASVGAGFVAAVVGLGLIVAGIYPSLVGTQPPHFPLVWAGVILFVAGFLAALVGLISG